MPQTKSGGSVITMAAATSAVQKFSKQNNAHSTLCDLATSKAHFKAHQSILLLTKSFLVCAMDNRNTMQVG